MLAFQAWVNAGIFGLTAALFSTGGIVTKPVVLLGMLSLMFIASALAVKRFGRLPLIASWLMAILIVTPHLPFGFMEGGVVGVPMFVYLLAGIIGASLLPNRGLPPVDGAPGAP